MLVLALPKRLFKHRPKVTVGKVLIDDSVFYGVPDRLRFETLDDMQHGERIVLPEPLDCNVACPEGAFRDNPRVVAEGRIRRDFAFMPPAKHRPPQGRYAEVLATIAPVATIAPASGLTCRQHV